MFSLKPPAALIFVLLFTGCSIGYSRYTGRSEISHHYVNTNPSQPGTTLELTYRVEGSNAIFESDHFRLIFTDMPNQTLKSFSITGGKLQIQVAGHGSSTSEVTCERNMAKSKFTSHYKDGLTTITFCNRKVLLKEGGTMVQEGEVLFRKKEFPVSIRIDPGTTMSL